MISQKYWAMSMLINEVNKANENIIGIMPSLNNIPFLYNGCIFSLTAFICSAYHQISSIKPLVIITIV
jgi:hypothetical protein